MAGPLVAGVTGVVAAAAGVIVGMGVLAIVGVLLVRRSLRRRWRALRDRAHVRGLIAAASALRSALTHGGGWRDVVTPRGATRLRIGMWQAVGSATRSVRDAAASGGAVAELPTLCRRLTEAAVDLDRLLDLATGLHPGASPVVDLRAQVGSVVTASRGIRLAALSAATDAAEFRARTLAEDADREVQSVLSGLARARAALGPSGSGGAQLRQGRAPE